jgi:hypothetical protein
MQRKVAAETICKNNKDSKKSMTQQGRRKKTKKAAPARIAVTSGKPCEEEQNMTYPIHIPYKAMLAQEAQSPKDQKCG